MDEEILAMYDAGMKVPGIASEMGLSAQTVRRILKSRGKETTRKSRAAVDEEAIVQAYQDGEPVPALLAKHSISYAILYKILSEHKIPTRKVLFGESTRTIYDRAVELYVAGAPLWAIKQETGIAQPTLHAKLHERNVPLRRPRLL